MLYWKGSRKDAQELANSRREEVKYHNPYWLKDIYEIIKPQRKEEN